MMPASLNNDAVASHAANAATISRCEPIVERLKRANSDRRDICGQCREVCIVSPLLSFSSDKDPAIIDWICESCWKAFCGY